MKNARWILPLSLLHAIAGCGGGASTSAATIEPTAASAPLAASPPRVAEGVTTMDPMCAEGAEERCDGLDSDCDGHVDEGCTGAAHAPIELAVAWSGGADLDLELDGPAESDGPASRGDCDEGTSAEAHLERRLARGEPAAGTYTVRLRHADACGGEGPITASVTVAALGRFVGTFNRAVAPGETVEVVSFDLAPAE